MDQNNKIDPPIQPRISREHKHYLIEATVPCQDPLAKAVAEGGPTPFVCLGLDVALAGAAGALTIGGATPLDLGKHSRESWTALCSWLLAQGCKVHLAQEPKPLGRG